MEEEKRFTKKLIIIIIIIVVIFLFGEIKGIFGINDGKCDTCGKTAIYKYERIEACSDCYADSILWHLKQKENE